MSKVYAYGCARPSRETRDAIEAQLKLAHQYRFQLWQLSIAQRTVYRELRREHVPELVDAENNLDRVKQLINIIDRKEQPTQYKELRIELQRWSAKCKELRESAKEHEGLTRDKAEVNARGAVLQRALRNVFSRMLGLYSGTYQHVEAAARSADAGKDDPQQPRWDGSGTLAIQLQDGRTPPQLFSGKDPSIHIEMTPRRGTSQRDDTRMATFHYRIHSDPRGRAVIAHLSGRFHRDLPEDARVTWAKLVVKRIHAHRYHYAVQLTTETALGARRGEGAGIVAVCLKDDRVTYACEYGEEQTYVFPQATQKISDLLSIRDQHRNNVIGLLAGWCERQDATADWVRAEIEKIQEHKSCRRLYSLRERLRPVVDERVMQYLDEWAYKENHLYWWMNDARKNLLNARKYAHRVFAADLRKKFRTVVVDSRKLNDKKRLTHERRWLGLHEMRLTLLHAFGEDGHTASGKSCVELCERFRATQNGEGARDSETANDPAEVERPRRAKRTGFARKHAERKEAARKALDNPAE